MLSDVKVRKAKPRERGFKLHDTGNLHCFILPSGGKRWRWRYSFQGKEKTLSLGEYPTMGLADARMARDVARNDLRQGRDPGLVKRARVLGQGAAADTFEHIARDWWALRRSTWTERHARDVIESLEADIFPDLGPLRARDVTPPQILAVLRRVEKRGAPETARRLRQRASSVFIYAIAEGKAEQNPAANLVEVMAPLVKGRQPAITDLDEARAMLAEAEKLGAHPITKLALRFLALTSVRPGEVLALPWTEIPDLKQRHPLWVVPAERMKMKGEHVVPLTRQAIEVLVVARDLTGRGPLVFPNARAAHRPMSNNAIGYLLHRAGYHGRHVPHGWRSTFSTVMNERFSADRAVIDMMLAHKVEGMSETEAAYNRSTLMKRRRELAQIWADLLLDGFAPAVSLAGGPRR